MLGEPNTPEAIFRELIEIWNDGDPTELTRLLSPDYRGHMLHLEQGERDGGGYPAHVQRHRENNPDVRYAVVEQFANGERLCSRLVGYRRDPVTGWEQTAYGINISRYEN